MFHYHHWCTVSLSKHLSLLYPIFTRSSTRHQSRRIRPEPSGKGKSNHNSYHLTPVRVAIKKQKVNVGMDVERSNVLLRSVTWLVGMPTGKAITGNSMNISQKKLKAELPCDPAILLLGIYPRETKLGSQTYLHCIFIAALFTIVKI